MLIELAEMAAGSAWIAGQRLAERIPLGADPTEPTFDADRSVALLGGYPVCGPVPNEPD